MRSDPLGRAPQRFLLFVPLVVAIVVSPAPAIAQAVPVESPSEESAEGVDPSDWPRPVARATRTREPIILDGRLDEPAWATAEPITKFVQSQPDRGALATEQTVARILYDERFLYIGMMLYHSEPDRIVVGSLERDYGGDPPRGFDVISFTLDPFFDRRNSFLFHVNAAGAIRDAQTSDDGRTQNSVWRGVWRAEAMVTDSGWVAEVAIPWTTLRFDPTREEQVWGLNFRRRVPWKNEVTAWAPLERHEQSHRMSRAGTLVGLDSVRSGHQLTVKPFGLLASAEGDRMVAGDRGRRWDGGIDVKYGITPRITLDLTYNTDFSQADDDEELVNLTRFSLFRPERRGFFLENASVFSFGEVTERGLRMGVSPRDFSMFHSRRLGLTDDGRTIAIEGGGRLTGRTGPFEVGLLHMHTSSGHGLPPEQFSVARVRRKLLTGSDVGVMWVNRQPTAAGGEGVFDRSYGVDANFRPMPGMVVNSYLARSVSPESHGGDLAWRLSTGWRGQLWDASALVREVGEAFDPALGFVRRRGIRHYYGTIGAHPGLNVFPVLETNPYLEVHVVTDRSGTLETRALTLGLETQFRDGGSLSLMATDWFERLGQAFLVGHGAEVAVGDYRFREGSVGYNSNRARPLFLTSLLTRGAYFDGRRYSIEAGATWRPHHRWSLRVAGEHNKVRLPEAAFTADVVSLRLRYAHTRFLFGRASIQYNGATDQLVSNFRINLVHAPLSDLFLVFAERRDLAAGTVLERGVTAKVTRLVAF